MSMFYTDEEKAIFPYERDGQPVKGDPLKLYEDVQLYCNGGLEDLENKIRGEYVLEGTYVVVEDGREVEKNKYTLATGDQLAKAIAAKQKLREAVRLAFGLKNELAIQVDRVWEVYEDFVLGLKKKPDMTPESSPPSALPVPAHPVMPSGSASG